MQIETHAVVRFILSVKIKSNQLLGEALRLLVLSPERDFSNEPDVKGTMLHNEQSVLQHLYEKIAANLIGRFLQFLNAKTQW